MAIHDSAGVPAWIAAAYGLAMTKESIFVIFVVSVTLIKI